MSVDFQQLQQQVKAIGESAVKRELANRLTRETAFDLLQKNQDQGAALQEKVMQVANQYDPNLRCARPVSEPLNARIGPHPRPQVGTIIAADGSQINPDRHIEVEFSLINVGAVQLELGAAGAPKPHTHSQLIFGEALQTATGKMTERSIALNRDLSEREVFLDLAKIAPASPVVTFTDGPLELWGAFDPQSASEFQERLAAYLQTLQELCDLEVITAGYVDKPGANLVIRLLEIAMIPEDELNGIRANLPLRGATDFELFSRYLPAGHRSAIFAIHSRTAAAYQGPISLHFFYLNVGREGHPYLARVEIPAWVAGNPESVQILQAILIDQCQILGNRTYPYLLHRAHEAAVVTRAEKDQITQMIAHELMRRGIDIQVRSYKQIFKELSGRSRYRPA